MFSDVTGERTQYCDLFGIQHCHVELDMKFVFDRKNRLLHEEENQNHPVPWLNPTPVAGSPWHFSPGEIRGLALE
jgi:hypothetical protein